MTRSASRRVWWRRGAWLGLGLAVLVTALAVFALGRPRHGFFEVRHGRLTDASVRTEVIESPAGESRFVSELVELRSDTGLGVTLRVLRPHTAPGPLPVIVLLAGHRTGSTAIDLIGDPGSVAIAALDYPYHGPQKFDSIGQAVAGLPEIRQALLDTPPAVFLAADWLSRQPWADARRFELVGASLGTPFAAVAGALDARFSRVWLIHGGAHNREWLAGTLRREVENPVLRQVAAAVLHTLAHGASFDTEFWVARIAPRPLVVIGARDDESLRPDNVRALYASAGEPKELIWTEGGHVTRHRTEVLRQLLDLVRARL